jgi:hypothetical protein
MGLMTLSRHTYTVHKAEPVVPEPSALEVEMAIGRLKKKQTARYSSNTSRNVSSRE